MNKRLWQKLYRWKLHHVLLWTIYYAFWTVIYRGYYDTLAPLLVTTGIYLVFNAMAFYLIAYFLVAKFLNEKRVFAFVFLALTVVFLSTLGLSIGLYLMFRDTPGATTFVNNWTLLFFSSLSSTGFVVGSLTAIKLIVEKIKSDGKSLQMERQRAETELQYLRAQVNPHFLFNAINSVYILIKKNPDLAAETLIKLSDLLRFQLYECSVDKISIEKELEYVQNYIDLEKLRKGEKIKVHVSLEGEMEGFQVAPFLFIPFLENAFKFVSRDADLDNEIKISLKRDRQTLIAQFSNSYDPLPGNGVGGIGLKNVKRRLELLYPEMHNLEVINKDRNYEATLSLDIS